MNMENVSPLKVLEMISMLLLPSLASRATLVNGATYYDINA